MRLVLADGSVVDRSAGERPELFRAARVGIGALGHITEVTPRRVPPFALQARDAAMPVTETLGRLDELTEHKAHFAFFWFPHSTTTPTRSFHRMPGDAPDPTGLLTHPYLDRILALAPAVAL